MLPKMAFTGFASRYREPTVDEGFADITKVNFKVRFWTLVGIQSNPTPPLSTSTSTCSDLPAAFNNTDT